MRVADLMTNCGALLQSLGLANIKAAKELMLEAFKRQRSDWRFLIQKEQANG